MEEKDIYNIVRNNIIWKKQICENLDLIGHQTC